MSGSAERDKYDVVVVGAGPAGLAAARSAAELGLRVALVDEQTSPGGLMYHGVARPDGASRTLFAPDYQRGAALVAAIRDLDIDSFGRSTVWHIDPNLAVTFSSAGQSRTIRGQHIIMAPGAMERPFPIPGWTLPGVMTAGAAQLLLKAADLAADDAVFAGTGPLLYAAASQYIRAGVRVRAVVDTTPWLGYARALLHLPTALGAAEYLTKGLALIRSIKQAGVPHFRGATDLCAAGQERLQTVTFKHRGRREQIETEHLLLHQGVVPQVSLAQAVGCDLQWDRALLCWRPRLGPWGESSVPGVSIAGDGAAIQGALAAEESGRLAALGAAHRLGRIDADALDARANKPRMVLARHRRIRGFLAALYRPRQQDRTAERDDVVVCRCEEITAGQIRQAAALGRRGPNQIKTDTRCGMGPCQGRQCALTAAEIIAAARGTSPKELGYLRVRPPVKPVTLGELARCATAGRPFQTRAEGF